MRRPPPLTCRPAGPARRRPGTAAVEFAAVLTFVLVPMMIGLWEMGRVVQVQQIVANSAREGRGWPQLRWSEDLTLPFDFKMARVTALLPTFAGDFNGDGRRDLLYGDGDGNARIRLGAAGARFGAEVASVPLGARGGAAAFVDLDGDRLDEIVFWDPVLPEGRLRIARNRGKLPGSPPKLTPAR